MIPGVDLFCGARGWEAIAHRTLDIDLLGIEHWEPAVLTSRAAGLRVAHADVSALDPLDFRDETGHDGILVASPPCQSRSNAGKQLGAQDVEQVAQCMIDLADGRDTRAELKARCADERSILTVEPLRWALALQPRVILLEQVPPVLPDWQHMGYLLERFGYSCWAGTLEAERYGVPQTRERAVLIARRDGIPACPPEPTHHRFVPKQPRPAATGDLLGGGLLPWVSMAEALGWDDGPAPAPAPTQANATTRQIDEPAPTIKAGHDTAERQWVAMHRQRGEGEWDGERGLDEPAFTVDAGQGRSGTRVSWVPDRPSTTVNADPRISKPGHHDENESGSQQRGAIRVTVEQAAALQSFPDGWPFQGSRTAQFTQVGNAVPPLLGEAILRVALKRRELRDAA